MPVGRAAFGQAWDARQGPAASGVRGSGLLGLRVQPLFLLAEESRSCAHLGQTRLACPVAHKMQTARPPGLASGLPRVRVTLGEPLPNSGPWPSLW